jgi:hypothetical protein
MLIDFYNEFGIKKNSVLINYLINDDNMFNYLIMQLYN